MITIKRFLILYCFLHLMLTQKGSSSSSKSSSRSHSTYRSSSSYSGQAQKLKCENKCLKNQTATKQQKQSCIQLCNQSALSSPIVIGIVGIIIVLAVLGAYSSSKQQEKIKNQLINDVKKTHIIGITQYEVAQYQIDQVLKKISDKKYQLTIFQQKNSYATDYFTLSIQKYQKLLYKVKINMKDQFGPSVCQGFLSITKNSQRLWFMKSYSDKQKSGQTGQYKYLIYDGIFENGQIINGKWHYKGFENSDIYSGKWIMKGVKTE